MTNRQLLIIGSVLIGFGLTMVTAALHHIVEIEMIAEGIPA